MAESDSVQQVVFVPWGDGDVDRHVVLGAAWLRKQPGNKVVFLPGKANYSNNRLLPVLTAGATVVTMRSRYNQTWPSGPVLLCWPTEDMFGLVSDRLRRGQLTAVCVLEWGDAPFQRAWLAAHNGIDLTTGRPAALGGGELPPVVRVAMEHLTELVNHSNGLVSSFDRDLAITTLQALVRGGYRYDVDELCSWALSHGFTGSEVSHLRDYAAKALAGHRFRLSGRGALRDDILKVWEAEAQNR